MKHKYVAGLIAFAVVTLGLAVFAFDNSQPQGAGVHRVTNFKRTSAPTDQTEVFLLKSHGKAIAELRALPGTGFHLSVDGRAEYNVATKTVIANGRVVLKITSGTNSLSVTADEIETVGAEK